MVCPKFSNEIVQGVQKKWNLVKIKIGDFVLITMGKSNELQLQSEKKLNFSALSRWLNIFHSTFGSPISIKRISQKLPILIFLHFWRFSFVCHGEPNNLQKMFNHLEKAEVLSNLQIIVRFP